LWKNGLTLSALGTVLYVLLKQRRVQKPLRRVFPWLFTNDADIAHYEARQKRIEAKIDALSAHMGVPPCGPYETGKVGVQSLKHSSKPSRAGTSLVDQLKEMMRLKSKFKSRKFWMAVVTAVLVVLNDGLNLGIDSETVLAFAGIVATFIIGESAVD